MSSQCPACNRPLPATYLKCPSCGWLRNQSPNSTTSSSISPTAPPQVHQPSLSAANVLSGAHSASPLSASVVYAGFWIRVGASLIDSLILLAAQLMLWFFVFATTLDPDSAGVAMLLAGAVIGLVYEPLFLASEHQATPGKMAMKIKVSDDRMARLSLLRAFGRSCLKIVSSLTFGIGYLMVAMTSRKQSLHDMMIGTVVFKR